MKSLFSLVISILVFCSPVFAEPGLVITHDGSLNGKTFQELQQQIDQLTIQNDNLQTTIDILVNEPVEIIPKVVDVNGTTVGYPIDQNHIAMSFNSQNFVAFTYISKDGDNFFTTTSDMYFTEPLCTGNAYISAYADPTRKQWGLPLAFKAGEYLYTIGGYVDRAPPLQSKTGVSGCEVYSEYVGDVYELFPFLHISSEFQPPFKLTFGAQVP